MKLTLASQAEVGNFQGLLVSLDGTTGQLMPPAAQFHIHNFKTGKAEVYFLPQISGLTISESAHGKPGASGKMGTWRCKVLAASRDEHDALVETLQQAGIDFRPGTPFEIPSSKVAEAPPYFLVEVTSEIDKYQKRAIAKILFNFIIFYLGSDEALQSRWDFLRNYVRHGEGEIKARLSQRPFWTGQETDEFRFHDDSINVRVENLDGNIVGAIQFYNLHTYEMILAENASLGPNQEIGRRFTPGKLPVVGKKLAI